MTTIGNARCANCGAPVRWAVFHLSGRRVQLDTEPTTDGNVILYEDGRCGALGKGEAHDGPRYTSHFATCPDAAKHRVRK